MFKRVLILALIAGVLSATAWSKDYDLVISNGQVMDPETMYEGVANVGVKDVRIAVITKALGKRTQTRSQSG